MSPASTKKERTRQRIVATAAREFRRHGFDGIGVADLMRAAGLTHGGFYAHFASKDELIAAAAEQAAEDAVTRLRQWALQDPGDARTPLARLVDAYLSEQHLHAPERGCPFAALGGELARQSPLARETTARSLDAHLRLIAALLPDDEPAREQRAMAVLASLVGAMTLARAVDDAALRASLLDATRATLLAPH